jgi:hypothetical protein
MAALKLAARKDREKSGVDDRLRSDNVGSKISIDSSVIAVTVPASLVCKSKDDKARRTAGLQEAMEIDMKLKITNEMGATYETDQDFDSYLVQDLGRGVFTVVTKKRGAADEMSIYAIPKTMIVKRKVNAVQAKSDAIFNSSASQFQTNPKHVLIACTYSYNR